MRSIKNDPALAELPAPMSLTPEQMDKVAAGYVVPVAAILHIAGGIPPALILSAPPPSLAA